MESYQQKKTALEQRLTNLGRVAVAFSGGVDSTFLLKVAHDALGENALAVTALTPSFPKREREEAASFCEKEGIRQILVEVDPFSIEGFRENPPNRCYLCKRALFSHMIRAANELGFSNVCDGSNTDDDGDYRPGLQAVAELNVKSPLREVGLTKEEIRSLSQALGLPTWDKPPFACLATRFVYGEPITDKKLQMVEDAEYMLRVLGFRQFRVRVHGDLARIEIDPKQFEKIIRPATASVLNYRIQQLGFRYVTLDLGGYVMGSMNKTLK